MKQIIIEKQKYFENCNKFRVAGRRSSARNYANKALSYQPSLGRAYLLQIFMQIVLTIVGILNLTKELCIGCSRFSKKASRVDNSLSKIAKKTADSYSGRAPSKTDIFTEGNAGL